MAVWLILFIMRKNVRKEMLIMSVVFSIIGTPIQLIYIKDWWIPLRITDTILGIEDVLFGFSVAGIAAVIYEDIFRKYIRSKKLGPKKRRENNLFFLVYILVFAVIFLLTFYLTKNSLYASALAFIYGVTIIYVKRPDLIVDSLATGFMFLILVIIIYKVVDQITPGWVNQFWLFINVPQIKILGVTIDDMIWYFLAGCFWGPLYKYWKEARLAKMPSYR
jgi:hypothetical protein